MTLFRRVDPAEAERLIQRFRVGHCDLARVLLENSDPKAIGLAVIYGQPLPKRHGGSKGERFVHVCYVTRQRHCSREAFSHSTT